MRVWSSLIAAVTMLSSAQALIGQVVGTITDQQTGAPISAVQVYLRAADINGLTDADGRFTLTDVPEVNHTIVAERIGYASNSDSQGVRNG